jgi:hypothetical protein
MSLVYNHHFETSALYDACKFGRYIIRNNEHAAPRVKLVLSWSENLDIFLSQKL